MIRRTDQKVEKKTLSSVQYPFALRKPVEFHYRMSKADRSALDVTLHRCAQKLPAATDCLLGGFFSTFWSVQKPFSLFFGPSYNPFRNGHNDGNKPKGPSFRTHQSNLVALLESTCWISTQKLQRLWRFRFRIVCTLQGELFGNNIVIVGHRGSENSTANVGLATFE